MVKIETLYNGVNALTWSLNGQPVDGCQWWNNDVIMFKGKEYKRKPRKTITIKLWKYKTWGVSR